MDLRTRGAAVLAAGWLVVGSLGCGGGSGNDCDAFVTINAATENCQARAERFGCSTFDADGARCGLFGCVQCTGEGDGDDGSES